MNQRATSKKRLQLEKDAEQKLREFLSEYRAQLLAEAEDFARGEPVSVVHLQLARDGELGAWPPMPRKATAQMHISAAYSENRKYETIAILMAIVLFFGRNRISGRWGSQERSPVGYACKRDSL